MRPIDTQSCMQSLILHGVPRVIHPWEITVREITRLNDPPPKGHPSRPRERVIKPQEAAGPGVTKVPGRHTDSFRAS
jgi:hypothetical protein